MRRNRYDGGDVTGMVFDPAHLNQHAGAVIIAKECGALLEKHYAGHQWYVEVDNRGGIVKIWAGTCSGQWGYVLKLEAIHRQPTELRRAVLKAGGEILERFKQPAGRYDREAWLAAPRDLTGSLQPDISDKAARVRRRVRDDTIDRAVRDGHLELKHMDEGGVRHLIVREGSRARPRDAG